MNQQKYHIHSTGSGIFVGGAKVFLSTVIQFIKTNHWLLGGEYGLSVDKKHTGGKASKWKWNNGFLMTLYVEAFLIHHDKVRPDDPVTWTLDYNSRELFIRQTWKVKC